MSILRKYFFKSIEDILDNNILLGIEPYSLSLLWIIYDIDRKVFVISNGIEDIIMDIDSFFNIVENIVNIRSNELLFVFKEKIFKYSSDINFID